MKRQKRKRNPLWLLALFASGIVVGEIAGVATALSLPDTWAQFRDFVSWVTGPIADERVADIGFVLLLAGVMVFALGLTTAYRRIRGRSIAAKDLRSAMPEISKDQEATLNFLMEHGITLRGPGDRPPRRSPIALSILTIAIGAAMVLFTPPRVTEKHFPPVALGGNTALASPHSNGAPDGSGGAEKSGGGTSEDAGTTGASASDSTTPFKGEGSSCTCPGGGSVEEGGGQEFEPPPEFEEPEEREEPEFEEPEFEEPEEAEFEAFGAEPPELDFEFE